MKLTAFLLLCSTAASVVIRYISDSQQEDSILVADRFFFCPVIKTYNNFINRILPFSFGWAVKTMTIVSTVMTSPTGHREVAQAWDWIYI